MTVYERLQNECKKKGLSITALCVEATGNKGNLATWKNNKGHMRSDYLIKCAKILNVSTDFLLGIEPEQNMTNNVSNNGIIGVVGLNKSSVNIENNQKQFDFLNKQEQYLLHIYKKATTHQQLKLMNLALSIEEEIKENNT